MVQAIMDKILSSQMPSILLELRKSFPVSSSSSSQQKYQEEELEQGDDADEGNA